MSAAEKMSRRDEMETLLPFYLNGSLEGSDLEAVEEWLASDPGALAALGEAGSGILRHHGGQRSDPAAGRCAQPLRQGARRRGRAGADPAARPGWRRPGVASWRCGGVAWAAAAVLLALIMVQSLVNPGGK